MNRSKKNNLIGLSLMEAMAVIGIMMVVLLIVIQIFILNYQIFSSQTKKVDNEAGAIIAAKTVSQMTRGAISIEPSRVFGSNTITSSSTALVLKLPSVDVDNNILVNTFDYVAFYRDDTETTKIFTVTDADPLSTRIDSTRLITAYNQTFVFRYNDPNIVQANRVSLYVQNQQTGRDTILKTRGWTSIFMRNY